MRTRSPYTLLTLVSILTVFLFLNLSYFNTRGEPREAIVAVSMLMDGNWILPMNCGGEIAFKPPFLHWLVAGISSLAGGVTEVTSRLPSALAAWVMVLATYSFFRRRAGETVALLTALLTLTNFEVHRAAMTCRVDMLLASMTVLSMYSFCRWGERGMKGVPFAAIFFAACAALTKGPIGAALPCLAAGLYLWMQGEKLKHLLWRFVLIGLACLVPLGVWYVLAYCQPHGGDRFLALVYEENVLRLTGKMTYASHENPWWYNVQTMVTGMLPYTLLLLFALPLAFRRVKGQWSGWMYGGAPAVWHRLRMVGRRADFAAVAFWTVFVFYCIPASKRSVYLLPCYPFAAYYVARLMERFARDSRAAYLRAFNGVLAVLAVVFGVLLLLLYGGALTEVLTPILGKGKHGAETLQYLSILTTWSVNALAALVPLAIGAAWFVKRRPANGLWGVAQVVAIYFALEGAVLPAVKAVKSDYSVAQEIGRLVPKDATLLSYRVDVVEGNRMHPFTINFYLNDRVKPVDKHEGSLDGSYLIVGNDEIENFKEVYPHAAPQLVLDSKHRSCDDKKVVKLYRLETVEE